MGWMLRLALMIGVVVLSAACAVEDDGGRQASTTQLPPAQPSTTGEGRLPGATAATTSAPGPAEELGAVIATTMGEQSGNRWVGGSADLTEDPIEVSLDAPPLWVVGADVGDGLVWVVVDADGRVSMFAEDDGGVIQLPRGEPTSLPAGMPPTIVVSDGELAVVTPRLGSAPLAGQAIVDGVVMTIAADGSVVAGDATVPGVTALTDGRIVVSSRGEAALLADPTDRLAHGVLGDQTESEVVVIVDPARASVEAVVDAPGDTVFEAVAPMWADVDGDGVEEVVVTASDDRSGARLVVYTAAGDLVAESEPIGTARRWLNQLAAAPVGPNGEVELVEIRTPHIGGVVRWHRLDGGDFELQAEARGFSTHSIGSRNLDLGVVVDADGDGRLDVVVPTQDRMTLVALERVENGAVVVAEAVLGARLSSNLSAAARSNGTTALAAGTEDGRLLIWPSGVVPGYDGAAMPVTVISPLEPPCCR